jgi:hypothetical protein
MKTNRENLDELRLYLNAAIGVLDYDRALYSSNALPAGRRIAKPLVKRALVIASRIKPYVARDRIMLAARLLAKRSKYINMDRLYAARHLEFANTFVAHMIALKAEGYIPANDRPPVAGAEAMDVIFAALKGRMTC